jgi:hypothetical protein
VSHPSDGGMSQPSQFKGCLPPQYVDQDDLSFYKYCYEEDKKYITGLEETIEVLRETLKRLL